MGITAMTHTRSITRKRFGRGYVNFSARPRTAGKGKPFFQHFDKLFEPCKEIRP